MLSTKIQIALNVGVPVLLAVILNVITFVLGWNDQNIDKDTGKKMDSLKLLPPGIVIAFIWVILLGLVGYVRYLVRDATTANIFVLILLAICLSYPFLMGLTNSLRATLTMVTNVVSLIVALLATVFVYKAVDMPGLYYMTPILVWLSYVNIATTVICSRKEECT